MGHAVATEFSSLKIAILTVTDTRTRDNDTSGDYLVDSLQSEGHQLADRALVVADWFSCLWRCKGYGTFR